MLRNLIADCFAQALVRDKLHFLFPERFGLFRTRLGRESREVVFKYYFLRLAGQKRSSGQQPFTAFWTNVQKQVNGDQNVLVVKSQSGV